MVAGSMVWQSAGCSHDTVLSLRQNQARTRNLWKSVWFGAQGSAPDWHPAPETRKYPAFFSRGCHLMTPTCLDSRECNTKWHLLVCILKGLDTHPRLTFLSVIGGQWVSDIEFLPYVQYNWCIYVEFVTKLPSKISLPFHTAPYIRNPLENVSIPECQNSWELVS